MDIIIIDKSDFLNRKPKEINNEVLFKKYDEIFKKYTCFSSNYINNFINLKNKNKNIYNNSSYKPNKYYKEDKKQDLGRIMTNLLNIVNTQNYNKIMKKIQLIKSTENVGIIIKELLDKCCIQIFFLDIYIKLLKDIINISNDNELEIIFHTINSYVNQYIDTIIYKINQCSLLIDGVTEYESFCTNQKMKNILFAKNMIIQQLMFLFKLDKSSSYYINILINDLKDNLKKKNDDNILIIFKMLIQFVKLQKSLIKSLFNIDPEYLYEQISCNKTKFVIEEFISLLY